MEDSGGAEISVNKGRVTVVLVTIVALGGVLWALFEYVISDAHLVLEYVRALVWPTVVAIGLFWLRSPLKDKLRELLRLEGFGTSVEFQERATRRLEAELAGAFEQLGATGESAAADEHDHEEANVVEPEAEAPIPAEESKDVESSTPARPPTAPASPITERLDDVVAIAEALGVSRALVEQAQQRHEAEPTVARQRLLDAVLSAAARERSHKIRSVKQRAETREGIEAVIRKSAAWGYDMGRAGAPRTVPDVEWNDDGTWQIVTEVPKRRPQAQDGDETGSLRQVKALEAEIKSLEREKHSPFGVVSLGAGNAGWLRELKRRLAAIDPGNPWTMS